MKKQIILMTLFIFTIILFGCSRADEVTLNNEDITEESSQIVEERKTLEEDRTAEEDKTEDESKIVENDKALEEEEIDFDKIKVDESAEVMVIMYHTLGKNSAYSRSVESFKSDINRLYEMGFRSISLKDFVNNNIDTPVGYTPVVLTFDDGHITNFKVDELDGEIVTDPDCVVGILEEFNKVHPDFGLEATFFLNGGTAFGQREYIDYKLNYILEKGMDIGNHSYGHEHLGDLTGEQIKKTLGGNIKWINEIIPGYEVNTLALPFGERPNDDRDKFLVSGSYENTNYKHISILKVGWKPEFSAINKKFNFERMNRVQSGDGDFQLKYYLDQYENYPEKRFISDGDPQVVTIPESKSDVIDLEKLGKRELRTY